MSDLAATNCGCGCGCEHANTGCCSNIIWIILLLSFCGNGSSGCGHNNCGFGGDNCIWIILLLCFCAGWGNNGGFCC